MELNVRLTKEKINIKADAPLAEHNSFRTGGEAQFFALPKNINEMATVLECAKEEGLPITILGGGTNVLISDKGVKGMVIGMNLMHGVTIKGDLISAVAGENLDSLINRAIEHNLTGLEELGGIPGTIGGATKGNSGAHGKDIATYFFYADYLGPDFKLHRMPSFSDAFSYRKSPFGKDDIILTVALRLATNRKTAEAYTRKEYFKQLRRDKGEFRYASAGCVFHNPEGQNAGALIDSCSLKGTQLGGALISPYHANFIVNENKEATSQEIYDLSQIAAKAVYERYGIKLEYEIKLLGDFSHQE